MVRQKLAVDVEESHPLAAILLANIDRKLVRKSSD